MRRGALLVVLAIGLLVAGCASERLVASTCGPAYVVHVGHRTLPSNSCAGVIPGRPIRFSLAVGARFRIEIGHEQSGVLDFPVPMPAGTEVRRVSRHGATVTYQARATGTTRLIAHHTRFCDRPGPRIGSCTAAVVRVTSS